MKILFVEDDDYKLDALLKVARNSKPDAEVFVARSFTSAGQMLKAACYDLIVLDMSLPTYDATENQSGGDAQGFGGRRVVRIADEYGNSAPTILVTQYATYEEDGAGRMTVAELAAELQAELGGFFIGTVAFDRAKEDWIEMFRTLIESASRI